MSFIEIVITLLILSLSIVLISNQINDDIAGISAMKNHIAEIYRNGL